MTSPGSRLHGESGSTLVVVLGFVFVISLLVTAVLNYATGSISLARHDQDWHAALAASEAGVDDYLMRLNRDPAYWLYSEDNPPSDGNEAFGSWVPVSDSDGEFRYTADTSRLATEGIIDLHSSGRVRTETRTVVTSIRRRGFLDYLYFTDYETRDPAAYSNPTAAQEECAHHYYDTWTDSSGKPRVGRGPMCDDIHFYGGSAFRDVIKGPLHSNDALLITGDPRFEGEASTSWDGSVDPDNELSSDGLYREGSSANPQFANDPDPFHQTPLNMPPSNAAIRQHAAAGGCLYEGPTYIRLTDDGKMDVDSPHTSNPQCTGRDTPLPANGVIYVDNLSDDVANCTIGNYPGSGGGAFTYPGQDGINVPPNNKQELLWKAGHYQCTNGDAFVWGDLDGRLTIAAENNVIFVWHTEYVDGGADDDMLGVVANNYVEIYHPVKDDDEMSVRNGKEFKNPRINAAILAVNHSFRVQNHAAGDDDGGLGTLNVYGTIAQVYRGPVGTITQSWWGDVDLTGYEKDYVYDARLRYMSPPHFIDPVKSAWKVTNWSEVTPEY